MDEAEFWRRLPIALNAQQRRAVCQTEGATLLLAVPGSGKTTVLVTRLGYLIYCRGVAPEQILTLTYTVAACQQMQARFAALFGAADAARLSFRTINGLCASILSYYANCTGRTCFSLLEDNAPLLAAIYQQHTGQPATEGELREVQQKITLAKNRHQSEAELAEVKIAQQPFLPIYAQYQRQMQQNRQMDYDDQLLYARTVLAKMPQVRQAFLQRFSHLCVDEAQDTSQIQHEIIRMLVGKDARLFMVGDEDQSIYGFRAAQPEALLRFETDYPGAQVLFLEENYRSARQIVAGADRFIAQNFSRRDKHLHPNRAGGQAVWRFSVARRSAQYHALAAFLKQSPQIETALLYRNNDSAIPMLDALERQGVSFRCRMDDALFFTNRVVQDLCALLQFSQQPQRWDLLFRVYYKLNVPISREAMARAQEISSQNRGLPPMDALLLCEEIPDWGKQKLELLKQQFSDMEQLGPRSAIAALRYDMGYGAYVLTHGADQEHLYLMSVLASQEETIPAFLNRLEQLRAVIGRAGGAVSNLTLSTIHASKGLEYDRVIVMDAIDGILPSAGTGKGAAELEEERRLFYVAATRAKEMLYFVTYQNAAEPGSFVQQFCAGARLPDEEAPSPEKGRVRAPEAAPLREGVRVVHKTFGAGQLQKIQQGIAQVVFLDGSVRCFSLRQCQAQGLLRAQAEPSDAPLEPAEEP